MGVIINVLSVVIHSVRCRGGIGMGDWSLDLLLVTLVLVHLLPG